MADWILALIVATSALALAVHWHVWQSRRALRAWLIVVGGGVLGGLALYVGGNFAFGWLYATSAVAAEAIALLLILAMIIETARRSRRRS
jgi:hypothetical protein